MFDYRRSHTCGALNLSHEGEKVTLSGWVHRRRDHGGLIFVDVRDRYGLTQLIFDPEQANEAHQQATRLRSEWVISIRGKVVRRGEGLANPHLSTGAIEVRVEAIQILSRSATPPFSLADEKNLVSEEIRLRHRYLDLRRPQLQKNLVLRHQAMMATREFLDKEGFLEIQTPILAKSTPEGARDYLVPSRLYPGAFYALPQSPQIFKQLLMVGGLDRYFQIAPCFRDEDLRADRQPEFTQIDLEMSFSVPEELFSLVEGLMATIFERCLQKKLKTPFRRMAYADAMRDYGTDKPDLRFGMPLLLFDDLADRSDFQVFKEVRARGGTVKGICVKEGESISRKGIDEYTQFVQRLGIKGLAWMRLKEEGLQSPIAKFFSPELQQELISRFDGDPGDLFFMIADTPERTNQGLDHLRREIARNHHLLSADQYECLWITDFPLFEWDPETKQLAAAHHPFTGVHPDDLPLLDSEPAKVRSLSYDLVINGYEVLSGSQRIHDSEIQKKIFNLLQLSTEEIEHRFGFFVHALQYGTPPHLGVGIGFDRLMMLLAGTDNIRHVIAFPKTQKANDLMMEAPSSVEDEQLDALHLNIDVE